MIKSSSALSSTVSVVTVLTRWWRVVGCMGLRHVVTLMLFLGMANAYVMRTNMSVAIVAMVNHTALPKDPSIVVDDCGSGSTFNNGTHPVSG
jgi:hypothetical protein